MTKHIQTYTKKLLDQLYAEIEQEIRTTLSEHGYTESVDMDEEADELWYQAMEQINNIHKNYKMD